QLWYQMAIGGRRDLPLAPSPRTGFEMTLLRMLAFRPTGAIEGTAPLTRQKPGAPARAFPESSPQAAPARGARSSDHRIAPAPAIAQRISTPVREPSIAAAA